MQKKGFLYLLIIVFGLLLAPKLNATKPDKNPSENPSKEKFEKKCENAITAAWSLRNSKPYNGKNILQKALKTCKKTEDKKLLAKAHNILGVLYRNISEYDSSYIQYKQALRYAILANDSVQIGYAYNNISGYFGYKNQLYLALEYAFKAAKIFEKINFKEGLAFADVEIALAYYYLKDYKKAEKFFNDVVKIRKELNEAEGQAVGFLHLGSVYLEQNKLSEAKKYLFKSYKIFVAKNNNEKGLGAVLRRLATIDCLQNKDDIAIKKFYNALSNLIKAKFHAGIVECYLGLSHCYFKKEKTDSALYYANLAYHLAKAKSYHIGYEKSLEQLYKIYSTIGNIDKTAFYFKRLIALRDSNYRKETLLRSEEFQKISEIRDLEEKNLKLKIDIKNKRLFVSSVLISLLLIFAFLIIILIQNRKVRIQSRQLTKTLEEKDKFMSIIAQDLRNPFSSLLSYADYLLGELNHDYNIEEVKNGIVQMRDSAYKLLEMVENLLYWARLQTGRIQFNPANNKIAETIEEVVNYFKQSLETKGIALEADVNPNYECYCDKDHLAIILRNIISNGLKLSNAGDKIKIYAEPRPKINVIDIIIEITGKKITGKQFSESFSLDVTEHDTNSVRLGMLLVKEMTGINKGKIIIDSEKENEIKVVLSFPMGKD